MDYVETLKSTLEDSSFEKEIYFNIFKILHEANKIEYINNSNGVFFNLTKSDQGPAREVMEYIYRISASESEYVSTLNKRETTEKEYKKIIEEKQYSPKKPSIKTEKEPVYTGTQEAPDILYTEPKYKGVYKKLNSIMKNQRKASYASLTNSKPHTEDYQEDDYVLTEDDDDRGSTLSSDDDHSAEEDLDDLFGSEEDLDLD